MAPVDESPPKTGVTAGDPLDTLNHHNTAYTGRRRVRNLALLVASNMLPLLGVVFFSWDVGSLIILYWSENLVLGAYNVIKMGLVGGPKSVFQVLFFIAHYGGFCGVHGFFILSLLYETPAPLNPDTLWPEVLAVLQLLVYITQEVFALAPREWTVAFIALIISHGYSFVSNFLGANERAEATLNKLMIAPYKRIAVLHVAIIAGGLAIASVGQPMALLIALIGFKTLIDAGLHVFEHRHPPGNHKHS